MGLADFGEILVFICKTVKTRRICYRCYDTVVVGNFASCCQAPDSSSCLSTGNLAKNLAFARQYLKPPYHHCLKPAALKNFVFDWELCFHLCEVYHFQNLVGSELPIKHTLGEEEAALVRILVEVGLLFVSKQSEEDLPCVHSKSSASWASWI